MKSLSKSKINKSVYEKNAREFNQQRSKNLFEKLWLEKFLSHLSKNAEILDVGCGTGDPIAKFLIEAGKRITGIDYSSGMIKIAKETFPNQEWIVGDMCNLHLMKNFEGIISWNAFFHLTQDEQRKVLPEFSKYLKPGGVIMLTIGHEDGEVYGSVNGESVYHSSLAITEYEKIFKKSGISILEFKLNDPDCQGHSVILARKF